MSNQGRAFLSINFQIVQRVVLRRVCSFVANRKRGKLLCKCVMTEFGVAE